MNYTAYRIADIGGTIGLALLITSALVAGGIPGMACLFGGLVLVVIDLAADCHKRGCRKGYEQGYHDAQTVRLSFNTEMTR